MIVGKPEATYEEITQKYDLNIQFSSSQENLFRNEECVVLSHRQMDDLVNQISAQYGMTGFLERSAIEIQPVIMSLYVFNESLWKIMEKKQWDKDKMLAMSTIPYCYWDQKEESASNPKSVKRWKTGSSKMVFKSEPLGISISGDGGDFCGFIEQSMIASRKFGIPETRKLIPNYQFFHIEVTAELSNSGIRIHPLPMQNLDYDFSAPAKEFHNHGVHLTIPGEQVTLEIEKRKPAKLKGEVHLLIASTFDEERSYFASLLGDIWFWSLHKLLGGTE